MPRGKFIAFESLDNLADLFNRLDRSGHIIHIHNGNQHGFFTQTSGYNRYINEPFFVNGRIGNGCQTILFQISASFQY